MNRFSFDTVVDRANTSAVKWDALEAEYGRPDLLALWVADMDFLPPPAVVEAIQARAAHGIYGYTLLSNRLYESVIGWMQRRHGWTIEKEWICYSPGVVTSLACLVHALTQPGDGIIIQTPVYHPFKHVIDSNGRKVVKNPLRWNGDQYEMDLEELEAALQEGAKMLILCSPHNPVGRVWKESELRALGDLCARYNTLIVSDEIHSDLIYKGYQHTPFARISDTFAMNSVTCIAPSKTFNLAGLKTSFLLIPNPEIRKAVQTFMEQLHITMGNTFGIVATEAAYETGDEWLDELMEYLGGNLHYIESFINENIPNLKVVHPEGTYLVWVDFRALGLTRDELMTFLRDEAGVALNHGHIFGPGGEGFERINIACPRSLLEVAMHQLQSAVEGLAAK